MTGNDRHDTLRQERHISDLVIEGINFFLTFVHIAVLESHSSTLSTIQNSIDFLCQQRHIVSLLFRLLTFLSLSLTVLFRFFPLCRFPYKVGRDAVSIGVLKFDDGSVLRLPLTGDGSSVDGSGVSNLT